MTNSLVSDIHETKNKLHFTLSNVNFSVANALRRTILSNIPCFVFKTTPISENTCEILVNTSKFNNEIIKQRLSCIPIHLKDITTDLSNYSLIVKKKNDTSNIIYVTTEDFQIYDEELKKYIDEKNVRKMFPPCPITKRYIDFIRLKPKISNELEGEEIDLKCKFSISTAKENGMYNVVSTCSYGNTIDIENSDKHWESKEKLLKKNKVDSTEISVEKKNWNILNSQRHFIPDSFDFTIESVGIYENTEIIKKACTILMEQLNNFNFDSKNIEIKTSDSTIENCFDITFYHEDYTVGKVLEYFMYNNYYEKEKKLNYCSFIKDHPHDDHIVIRIGFKEETEESKIKTMFNLIFQEAKDLFTHINEQFN